MSIYKNNIKPLKKLIWVSKIILKYKNKLTLKEKNNPCQVSN